MPQDTQIFVGDNQDGSSDYQIPGNAEIRVKAVNANFVDNGAGADWCPAVVMFSDSGSVIARALLPDVKVTAGDDAEVSWFPGVKPGSAAAAGTSLPVAFLDTSTPFTLNTWTPNVYTPVTWDFLDTNDASAFSWPGSGGSTTVRHLTGGVFRCVYQYSLTGFAFPAAPGLLLSKVTTSVSEATLQELSLNHANAALYEGNPNVGAKWSPIGELVFNYGFPDDLTLNMAWTGAGSVTIQSAVMFLYRLGDKTV